MRRVVITGMGAVTPFGVGTGVLWDSVKAGNNGVDKVTRIDVSQMPTKVAAEVRDFNPSDYIERKDAKRMDRFTQYAFVSALLAYEQSGLKLENEDLTRAGVIIGSGIGGLETLEEQHKLLLERGPGRVSPFFIPMMIANMAGGRIALDHGYKGDNFCPVSACASSANAIGEAFRKIKYGTLDAAVTGGSEAAITKFALSGFHNMGALAKGSDMNRLSIPFDKERSGFVMGDGAGILILEEMERAKARGAHIYAEVTGYGSTDDAFHITGPNPGAEASAKAMEFAVAEAGIKPEDVGYINAHGTSTELNDKIETAAIKAVFGEHARKLAVSSTKSVTGHLLGAAGAIEAVICAKALEEGILPPTANYKVPDIECDLDYITEGMRKTGVANAISNSLGFGGHNATLAFQKYKGA